MAHTQGMVIKWNCYVLEKRKNCSPISNKVKPDRLYWNVARAYTLTIRFLCPYTKIKVHCNIKEIESNYTVLTYIEL